MAQLGIHINRSIHVHTIQHHIGGICVTFLGTVYGCPRGGDESGVAISQIPDFLGLYSLIPDFLGLYSLIPDFWGLYSLIPDFRPLRPVPTFSRPIIMFYSFHMIEKIYMTEQFCLHTILFQGTMYIVVFNVFSSQNKICIHHCKVVLIK